MQQTLTEIVDRDGSAVVGWVGRGVLYARFARVISSSLGQRYAVRLDALSRQADQIRYFTDMSHVTTYDLLARSAMVKSVMANRNRFQSITTLTWSGGITASGQAVAAAIGVPISYIATPEEFLAQLALVAPSARAMLADVPRDPVSHRHPRTP